MIMKVTMKIMNFIFFIFDCFIIFLRNEWKSIKMKKAGKNEGM